MKHLKMMTATIVLAIAAADFNTANAAERQLNPKAVTFKLPEQIPWKRNPANTNENAVLYGDPDKPGLYALMTKAMPGNIGGPHWHPNDRVITVLRGTWWVGTGEKLDLDSMVPMPAGTVVTHFGKEIHYDGAKEGEAWLLIVGEGPATGFIAASTPPPAH